MPISNTYTRYMKAVNMTHDELLMWSKNPCSRKASLDRKPIQRNLRLLKKPLAKWTLQDEIDAKKTIAFIARMKKVKSGDKVKGCGMSKRDISLINWAYDPRKKR